MVNYTESDSLWELEKLLVLFHTSLPEMVMKKGRQKKSTLSTEVLLRSEAICNSKELQLPKIWVSWLWLGISVKLPPSPSALSSTCLLFYFNFFFFLAPVFTTNRRGRKCGEQFLLLFHAFLGSFSAVSNSSSCVCFCSLLFVAI